MSDKITAAAEKFTALVKAQLERNERIKSVKEFTDYAALDTIVVGVCGGDGIGPVITAEAQRVLEHLLQDEVAKGKVAFKVIDGLTIENRVAAGKAIPDDVLAELKQCHVILKGPTTTPRAGDPWPNIESANVAMRKELDLFANVRPVKVPDKGIDWTFFRENTEGAYALGSSGFAVDDEVAFDFVVATTEGTQRIARLAYDYARKNHKERVSIITKANVVKTTDGKFLKLCQEIGKEYPDIITDDWYIDITTARTSDTPACSRRPSTAPPPAWWLRAAPPMLTPAPCCGPPCCSSPTSATSPRPTSWTAPWTSACTRRKSSPSPAATPAAPARSLASMSWQPCSLFKLL